MKPYNVAARGPGFILTYTATGGPTVGRAVDVATFSTRPAAELAAERRNVMMAAAGRYLRATDAARETARQFDQAAAELDAARSAYRSAVAAIRAERRKPDGRATS